MLDQSTKEDTDNFIFTEDQQKLVLEHYGFNVGDLEFYKVCELLDMLISEAVL